MTDEQTTDAAARPTVPPPRRRRWKWPLIILATIVLVPILVFAVRVWIALGYTYSSGDRNGYVQKLSHKGWICKTWEGELAIVTAPGVVQEKWLFSVRSDSVAHEIQKVMGNRVSLTYEEHPGVPTSCFGETRYFVVGVRQAQP